MADYRALARRTAKRHGLDPDVFERQIQQESGFNPSAHSPAGAAGIAQIMPATARGWGVDPMDPAAALDAAAKNMRSYVDKYGGYENALRAYNAGPGAIQKSKGFAETNNYVKTILGGKTPATPAKTSSGGSGGSTRTTTTTTPGVDNRQARAQLVQSFLSQKGADPVAFALQARELADVAPTTSTKTQRLPGQAAPKASGSGGSLPSGSGIRELFWQGQGGINIKDGAVVPQGFVSGHTDHVHVAAGPETTVELGKIAQQRFGLHVGENPQFGGVAPVHAKNSYHYRNQAIDVSGDAKKMAQFARYVKRYSESR